MTYKEHILNLKQEIIETLTELLTIEKETEPDFSNCDFYTEEQNNTRSEKHNRYLHLQNEFEKYTVYCRDNNIDINNQMIE